jgi:hypothetical protein
MRWAGHVVRVGGKKKCIQILVGKPEGKRPLEHPDVEGRIILRWIFQEWDGIMDWIDLASDRDRWRKLANAVMNFRVP